MSTAGLDRGHDAVAEIDVVTAVDPLLVSVGCGNGRVDPFRTTDRFANLTSGEPDADFAAMMTLCRPLTSRALGIRSVARLARGCPLKAFGALGCRRRLLPSLPPPQPRAGALLWLAPPLSPLRPARAAANLPRIAPRARPAVSVGNAEERHDSDRTCGFGARECSTASASAITQSSCSPSGAQ